MGRIPLRLVHFWKRRLPGLKFGGVAGALLGVLIRKQALQKRSEERFLVPKSDFRRSWLDSELNLEVHKPSEGLPRALRDVPEVEKPLFFLGKTTVLAYSLFATL